MSFHRPIGLSFCVGFPFVVKFFAAAKPDLHFDVTSREIERKRNDRESLLLNSSLQFQDLFSMHQEFFVAQWLMIESVSLFIRADVYLATRLQFVVGIGSLEMPTIAMGFVPLKTE